MIEVTLSGCEPNSNYPIHIHAGTACTDATTQGGHWGDMSTGSGDGIPEIPCVTGGTGTLTYTRLNSDATNGPWTIGGAAGTNVAGHVLVIHNPFTPDAVGRTACGAIVAQ
jgi:hypothetical protein